MSVSLLTDYGAFCRRAVEAAAQRADAVNVPSLDGRYLRGGTGGIYRAIETLALAYFDDQSPRRGEEAVWQRLTRLADALQRRQHDDGLIDLSVSNFHSPPDAAFMVEALVPLYDVLRHGGDGSPRREEFLGRLESIIVPACDGIVRGGVHTPNHRWKVASALTLADKCWPHEAWRAEARAYLAEGIDIDEDGEFTERSTGTYNYVCDLALILLGRATGRADYLRDADRNLEHMLYLLHADGTLVTSYSRRQDRYATVGVERHLLLYWYRAMMGGNGRFLSAAELGLRRLDCDGAALGRLAKWLRYFRDAADKTPPEPQPLPEEYEVRFDNVGVLRRRHGSQSLTLIADAADLLSVRFADGPAVTLRIATALATTPQFLAERIEGADGHYRLRSHHVCEYYGPGPDRLPATNWRSRPGFSRRVFVGAELTMTAEVESSREGLRLHLRSDGCQNVPIELAFLIRDAVGLEADGRLEDDRASGKRFLNSGELIVRGRRYVLRIGPGAAEYDLPEIPAAEKYDTTNTCCIRLLTPVDTTVTIRALKK